MKIDNEKLMAIAGSDADELVGEEDEDDDKLNEAFEDLDQRLDDELTAIRNKNRAVVGWKPPVPPLLRLQKRFTRLKKEGKDTLGVEEQIIKHYSKEDVPQ